MRLILGVANFDKNYGISNKIKISDINAILKIAKSENIKEIDTAFTYTKSNYYLKKNNYKKYFKINTKIPLVSTKNYEKKINNYLKIFKKKSGCNKINTLLFHDPKQIFIKDVKKIVSYIVKLKKKKIINNYGFSIYNVKELNMIIQICNPDVIQVPLNIFDQRFIQKKTLLKIKKNKIRIQFRSIFLQGLSLKKNNKLKDAKSNHIIEKYWNIINLSKLSPLENTIIFLKSIKHRGQFILSADNKNQLKEILSMIKRKNKNKKFKDFKTNHLKLLNPYLWPVR